MTEHDLEEYEARLLWFKALDAATEAALARILATLASNPNFRVAFRGKVRVCAGLRGYAANL